MAFYVDSITWLGAFIGGQPFAPGISDNIVIPGDAGPVEFQVHVETSEAEPPFGYVGLGLMANYPGPVGSVTVDFGPPGGAADVALLPGVVLDYPGLEFTLDLIGYYPDLDPPPLPPYGVLDSITVRYSVPWSFCPLPPTSPGGGCPSGDLRVMPPDPNGVAQVSYSFGGGGDPNGIGSRVAFNTNNASWGFMALPGDVSLQYLGDTAESTPREVWHATVPAGDGTTRLYCSDSSTGDFVPVGPYGTTFGWNGSEYVETVGGAQVCYDSSGVLQRVINGGSVHTYSYDGAWVDIEANTSPPTKVRYSKSGGIVQSVHQYVQLPGAGWVEARQLAVAWSGDQIATLTSYPGDRTTSFSYNPDGSLASYEDCSGREYALQYEEA